MPATRSDELDLLAADPWLRELVVVSGGRPPARSDSAAVVRWRLRYLRALVTWAMGRRARSIALFGECAALVSAIDGDEHGDVARGFRQYIEGRFRCVVHDDCLHHPMMGHDCWLEEPERAR